MYKYTLKVFTCHLGIKIVIHVYIISIETRKSYSIDVFIQEKKDQIYGVGDGNTFRLGRVLIVVYEIHYGICYDFIQVH